MAVRRSFPAPNAALSSHAKAATLVISSKKLMGSFLLSHVNTVNLTGKEEHDQEEVPAPSVAGAPPLSRPDLRGGSGGRRRGSWRRRPPHSRGSNPSSGGSRSPAPAGRADKRHPPPRWGETTAPAADRRTRWWRNSARTTGTTGAVAPRRAGSSPVSAVYRGRCIPR